MQFRNRALLLFSISIFGGGCSYRVEKEKAPQSAPTPELVSSASFASVYSSVFQPKCVSCHGAAGGVNLESAASARSALEAIRRTALVERRMPPPPNPPLTNEEHNILAAWIEAGGPDEPNSTAPPSPSPDPISPAPRPGPIPEPAPPPPNPPRLPDPGNRRVFYSAVKPIFQAKCVACHGNSGGVNLATYSSARAALSRIHRSAIVERRMPLPPYPPLTARELALLNAWIQGGGLNDPVPVPSPQPRPTPPRPEPTFSSIQQKILAPKCIACHREGGRASNIPFGTKDEILRSPYDLVIPGAPSESGIVLVLQPNARKPMPPPDSGFPPVTQEELSVIEEWIRKGAEN